MSEWLAGRGSGIGGEEQGLRGGRQRGKKVLTGIAVEILEPRGIGRCRMAVLADASAAALGPFVEDRLQRRTAENVVELGKRRRCDAQACKAQVRDNQQRDETGSGHQQALLELKRMSPAPNS